MKFVTARPFADPDLAGTTPKRLPDTTGGIDSSHGDRDISNDGGRMYPRRGGRMYPSLRDRDSSRYSRRRLSGVPALSFPAFEVFASREKEKRGLFG